MRLFALCGCAILGSVPGFCLSVKLVMVAGCECSCPDSVPFSFSFLSFFRIKSPPSCRVQTTSVTMGVWASENSALQNTKAVILRRGRGGIAIVILISVFFILALFSFPSSSIPYDVSRSARSNFNIHAFKDNLNHIRNSTLGVSLTACSYFQTTR